MYNLRACGHVWYLNFHARKTISNPLDLIDYEKFPKVLRPCSMNVVGLLHGNYKSPLQTR